MATAATGTQVLIPLGYMGRLSLLDEQWSAYLEAAHDQRLGEEPDFPGLLELADQINDALGEVAEAAANLRAILEQLEDSDSQQVIGLISEWDPAAADAMDEVLRDLEVDRPEEAFIAACRFLEDPSAEREVLSAKRGQLLAEALPDPDLSPKYECMLAVAELGCIYALAAAGAVSVFGAPIAIGLGEVGGAIHLRSKWKKSGCKKAWKQERDAFAT
jgi:hypothetical protein